MDAVVYCTDTKKNKVFTHIQASDLYIDVVNTHYIQKMHTHTKYK